MVALFLTAFLVFGQGALLARQAEPTPAGAQAAAEAPEEAPKLSPEQLESLVAPIALYSDDLLAQCLVASTYPIDVIQAQQWLDKNKNLKGEALSKEAMKQSWDPSIQALVSIPDALKVLSQDIKWTTDLGDAFLAQQADVMGAVQRMRAKAKDGGKLASNEQMKVETKVVEEKQVIIIEQSNPEVVYVPSYSPTVVYGAAPYPYPPLYYPPYYGGAWVGFGVGVAVGIGIAGGWGCGWGHNDVTINNNNNYVNHNNRQNNVSNSGNSSWKHNAQQRGGAPYKDKATANKYGGGARGEGRGGTTASTRDASRGGGSRGGAGASSMDAGRGGGGRDSGRGSGGSSFSGGGGDRVGSRDMGSSGSRGSSGFSGSGAGSRGASASSSRGSSSFSGGSRGGSSGGGGRGGGGGGRRR